MKALRILSGFTLAPVILVALLFDAAIHRTFAFAWEFMGDNEWFCLSIVAQLILFAGYVEAAL